MVDWKASMIQTFEFYVVDPTSWTDVRRLDSVKSCSISRDANAETLGSATIDITESVGECYIRVYLITIQNGVREKHPLGTFLVQTPLTSFNGKIRNISVDAYTPLIELKEKPAPIGYTILKDDNIMEEAYMLTRTNARAPVVKTECDTKLFYNYTANINDTWLVFLQDLMANAKYVFDLDEMGRILFAPDQDAASLQPVWTYDDDNSSILYPEIDMEQDMYNVPNVVDVVYSSDGHHIYAEVVNDDENSPFSTVNRGRRIVKRITDPDIVGNPSYEHVQEYAHQKLRDLSALEYTITYSHGYCPVRVGDCVRLNYARAGITNIKAKVISQTIDCTPGCRVTEKAVFTINNFSHYTSNIINDSEVSLNEPV